MIKKRLTISLSFLLASLVFLSSLHASQIIGAIQKTGLDDGHMAKVTTDLHHHSDKTGMQLVKDPADQQMYVDNRNLRAHRSKKELPYRYRVAGWLNESWRYLAHHV